MIYKYVISLGLTAVLFAVPSFGFITDHLSTGAELLLSFGVRSIAGFGFFALRNPNSGWLTFSVMIFMLASSLEEVCIESLFSKRLPGDIRAAMISLQFFFGKLGHFTFAVIAILTVTKYGIRTGLLAVAIADLSVVVIVFILSYRGKFAEDPHAGEEAIEQGKKAENAELKAALEREQKLKDEVDRLKAENARLKEELKKNGIEYVDPADEKAEEKDLLVKKEE